METKKIVLDGVTNGIAIYLMDQKDFIRTKAKKVWLFKSMQLAKAFAANRFHAVNPKQYLISIVVGEDIVEFDSVYYDSEKNNYQFCLNSVYYIAEEINTEQVLHLGYIIFDEPGEIEDLENNKGKIKKQKELYRCIRNAISEIVQLPALGIRQISKDANGHLCLSIANSTAKVHICYNNQIMNLNQKRKEQSIRCLPYEKDKDKFTTFYIYSTKDMSESDGFEPNEKGLKIINLLIDFIDAKYPDTKPRFSEVEFHGIIIL